MANRRHSLDLAVLLAGPQVLGAVTCKHSITTVVCRPMEHTAEADVPSCCYAAPPFHNHNHRRFVKHGRWLRLTHRYAGTTCCMIWSLL